MTSYAPLASGRVLVAGYTVDEHLARGEALDVYSVWSEERESLCVAKTVRPDRRDDAGARDRLLREGALLHRLDHPHLVRAYETFESPPVAVLETLSGQTLSHLTSVRVQGLAAPDLLRLGLQLCSVVRYLHRCGTLHLDLKPSNIVLDAGRARVLDLSHARPPGPCPAGFGTAEYMPPEQLIGGRVSEASDVFGLGGVLYRAATRRRPYGTADRSRDPYRPPPMRALRRRRPAELAALVAGCLDPHRAARPTTIEVRRTLEKLAGAEGSPPGRKGW